MNPRNWTDIQSIIIDGKLALTKLIRGGRQSAIFETVDPESDGQPTYFVQLVRDTEEDDGKQILNRLEEARYLTHPGVVLPLGIGTIANENLVFCVTNKPLSVLAEVPGPMPLEEAHLLTRDLVQVLSYLHSENLVFCNLRPEAVWKTENGWVLSDFSQLRLMGRSDTHELRRALVRYGDIPPEAYQGVVSPAWDVWSLGVLLQRVFTGDPGSSNGDAHPVPRARQLRAGLPEPFQKIVRECLDPNPAGRPSLERVEELLNGAEPEDQPQPEIAVPVAAPPVAAAPVSPPPVPAPAASFEWTPRHLREMDETQHPRGIGEFFRTSRLSWLVIFIVGLLGVAIWIFALTRKTETPGRPAQVAAALPSEADRVNPRSAPPAVAGIPADPAVREVLDKYVATTRAKDVGGQVSLYAPIVDTFFAQHHVSRSKIASIKKRTFNTIGTVKKFDASNVQITQLDPNNAVILFDKSWTFGSNSQRSGTARSQLTLRKIDGEWKVLAERDLSSNAS